MSTSSSTQSAMYHGVDFWKTFAWVKDELAARLNSFVRRWDSSSKTLRLTIGRGGFQLAVRSRGCRSRSTSATSRSLWLLAGNFSSRMWSIHGHTHSALFAEIWIASLAPTFLVGYQFASRRRIASQVLGARRSLPSPWSARGRSFPPGTGRPSSGPLGNGPGSDGHGALESTSVGSPVVERKRDGGSRQRAKRPSGIPITFGYRLHGER